MPTHLNYFKCGRYSIYYFYVPNPFKMNHCNVKRLAAIYLLLMHNGSNIAD